MAVLEGLVFLFQVMTVQGQREQCTETSFRERKEKPQKLRFEGFLVERGKIEKTYKEMQPYSASFFVSL